MRTGGPKAELVLTHEERCQLQSFARSRSLTAALSNRLRLVLATAEGEANYANAVRLRLTAQTVGSGARFLSSVVSPACPTTFALAQRAR